MSNLRNYTQTSEEKEVCLDGLARFLTLWSREKLENDFDLPKVRTLPGSWCVFKFREITIPLLGAEGNQVCYKCFELVGERGEAELPEAEDAPDATVILLRILPLLSFYSLERTQFDST